MSSLYDAIFSYLIEQHHYREILQKDKNDMLFNMLAALAYIQQGDLLSAMYVHLGGPDYKADLGVYMHTYGINVIKKHDDRFWNNATRVVRHAKIRKFAKISIQLAI